VAGITPFRPIRDPYSNVISLPHAYAVKAFGVLIDSVTVLPVTDSIVPESQGLIISEVLNRFFENIDPGP
jgi:hypothetical protein